MEVPKSVLSEWKARKQRGDVSQIHRITGISRVTIDKAINKGIASAEVILKISQYYSDKEPSSAVEAEALKILKKKK